MRLKHAVVALVLWGVLTMHAISAEKEPMFIDGVVAAILKTKGGIRTVDPNSMGDLAEVYMVRVGPSAQSRIGRYILVEYSHHDSPIPYDQFDKTQWKFEVIEATSERSNRCVSWLRHDQSFVSTSFGSHKKLPDPKTLTCFLTTKRPVPSTTTPTMP